jgi:DNA modification methylase
VTVRILRGDVRERLADLPDDSVNCVVTSPPYYGLRAYGTRPVEWPDGWIGELGQEPTLDLYIDHVTLVFREVRRVLRADGTCWLNIGDSYASNPGNGRGGGSTITGKTPHLSGTNRAGNGFKPKDLMMVPARLAIALQDDGWFLRSDIIWHKPNPMPESAKDRPTNAHEHVFLLTKNSRYWYDADAVRTEPKAPTTKMPDGWETGTGAHGSFHRDGRERGIRTDKQRGHSRRHDGFNDRWDAMTREEQQVAGANLRNVWTIATQPFPDAHFATFPEELVRTCIRAGCPAGGTVLDPFGGSGTTGLVADQLGRDAILVELNPEYAVMAERRIVADAPLLAEVAVP